MDKLLASQIIKANARLDEVMSSGSGSSYTAGDGIDITSGEISAKIGEGLEFDANGAIKATGGSGEQWEDITSELLPYSSSEYYKMENGSLDDLIENIPLRITVELSSKSGNDVFTTGATQLYVTANMVGACHLLTNTIYLIPSTSFTGLLVIGYDAITYEFGTFIEIETERPKILKVERLVV